MVKYVLDTSLSNVKTTWLWSAYGFTVFPPFHRKHLIITMKNFYWHEYYKSRYFKPNTTLFTPLLFSFKRYCNATDATQKLEKECKNAGKMSGCCSDINSSRTR